jgi:hypothetical protein
MAALSIAAKPLRWLVQTTLAHAGTTPHDARPVG